MAYTYHSSGPDNRLFSDAHFEIHLPEGHDQRNDLIVPDCTPGILIIQEGELQRTHLGSVEIYKAGEIYLFGQKTSAVRYSFSPGPFRAFGCKLIPVGLQAYFGIAAEALTNQSLVLSSSEVNYCVYSKSFQLSPIVSRPEWIDNVLKEIHRSGGGISIQDLADKYRVGYKQLERVFKRYIGITPKLYARIVRFNHTIKFCNHPLYRLTDLAYQGGYFDQNHFIKETKKFTGLTPSQLLVKEKQELEMNQLKYLLSRDQSYQC